VNYNVAYFLEQCLNSVFKALESMSGEVIVIDNNSIDGSTEMVKLKFPSVILIENKINTGFSKANNQGINLSSGKYILLLNPDTVVEESTFLKTIHFLENHPKGGGLGVKMVDGKGKFLPESKRGLPTPLVAFYKIFGLSSLFPKSKIFGRYHLGYLPVNQIHKIEILSGAFMLIRKSVLDEIGLLDETFFMYGEDIDLSYRIIQSGYENYYFPDTSIIHYKGESTKKSSINYVFVFYKAMIIFAKKHYSTKHAKLFSIFINLAIYLRASIALGARFLQKSILPLIDFISILFVLFSTSKLWELAHIKFQFSIISKSFLFYTLTWMITIYFTGGYENPKKSKKYFTGGIVGMLIILVVYGLLPKEFHFSRLFILISTFNVILYFILSRNILCILNPKKHTLKGKKEKRFLIVGSEIETERVENLLHQTFQKIEFIESIITEKNIDNQPNKINQIDQITFIKKIDEVIFCSKDISSKNIIQWMSILSNRPIEFKIAQPDVFYLIGSNSSNSSGESYSLNLFEINSTKNLRNKRSFDFIAGILLLITFPITFFIFKNKKQLMKNSIQLIFGLKTLVGYEILEQNELYGLPKLKKGILHPSDIEDELNDTIREKLNLLYARDYSIWKDFELIQKSWRAFDRS
jgi:GT2 family glycosyltransferase